MGGGVWLSFPCNPNFTRGPPLGGMTCRLGVSLLTPCAVALYQGCYKSLCPLGACGGQPLHFRLCFVPPSPPPPLYPKACMGGGVQRPPRGVGRGSCCASSSLTVSPRPVCVHGWVPSLCTLQQKFGQRFPPFFMTCRGGGLPAQGRLTSGGMSPWGVGGGRIFDRGPPYWA